MCPFAEKASPCLPNLVGNTQSNISNPSSIAWDISSGVPTPIKYLGTFVGSFEAVYATTSRIRSLDSPTLTPPTAIPSRAYWLRKSTDCCLKSKYVPPWTIGNNTQRTCSYFGFRWSKALLARRCVICICFSIVFLSAHAGEQTSNTIIISDHRLHWISTTRSGVNSCLDPSYGERNFTPFSVNFIFTSCLPSSLDKGRWGGIFPSEESFFPNPRENTWKPPLSVRISLSRFSKECSPHAAFISSSPGRKYKWKVFAKMSWIWGRSQIYFGSLSISRIIPLIVAFVPTGIKTGVVKVIPLRVICQTLAFHFCLSILKSSLDIENMR